MLQAVHAACTEVAMRCGWAVCYAGVRRKLLLEGVGHACSMGLAASGMEGCAEVAQGMEQKLSSNIGLRQ